MMGKGSVNHNTRAFSAKNVDKERSRDNVEFCHEDIKAVYHELFDEALERYNAKQKRSDRKIENYYEKIRQGKQEKLFYEVIFQIGNRDDMNARSEDAVTLLDINNSVPKDMYKESIEGKFDYTHKDTFMGFHCGNTCSKKLASCEMKNQMIMARSLPVEVTNGTLEGDIAPGDITFYRLQSTSDNKLRAYVAQGEVLPVATRSFGSIGVFAIHEMGRFYRHVLIEKNYPHHGAVAFGHYGKALFEVFKYIGVPMEDINYNQPASLPYPTENPFA